MKAVIFTGAFVLVSGVSAIARAQSGHASWPMPIDPASATTGSSDEESLLLLQLVGRAPLLQTSIRSFSARELDTLTSFERPTVHAGPLARSMALARPQVSVQYNFNRAFSENDGVVWAGRGATIAGSFGGTARVGPFSFAVRPVAFWTQNRPYRPVLGVAPDSSHFADPGWGTQIDLPYRFGNHSYGRIDPGESWAQLDTRFLVAGVSTATQVWGPMHVYPLLLGPNAGGFPHVLLGTGLPWNIFIGKLSARAAVGRLDQSAFAPAHTGEPRRLASELVAVFTPRWIDGLEIGGGRFFHRRWPDQGVDWSVLRIPFEALLKEKLPTKDSQSAVADNQLASAFFRIVRPSSGVEVYGEFLRDDHNYDLNDLVGEPDHESAYGLGMRKAWTSSGAGGSVTAVTFEFANGRISRLQRLRGEDPMYIHTEIVEGHTERGQLLGSPAVYGGGGYHLDVLRRNRSGGWRATIASENLEQNAEGGTWNGTPVGHYIGEFSRIFNAARGELTATASAQFAWNRLSGGNNLGFAFSYRPSL